MNWLRLLEILEMARRRTGREPDKRKPDQGYNWACYCGVCCELRRLAMTPRGTATEDAAKRHRRSS